MTWGNFSDMKYSIKRLKHFSSDFKADGPFTALTPFGRNFAALYDCGNEGERPREDEYIGCWTICAFFGTILADKCNDIKVKDDEWMQAEIASWWWRANEFILWEKLI